MTFSSDFSQADFYPLIRSGGAFLLLLGAAMLTGGLMFRFRYAILAAGAAVAAVTLVRLWSADGALKAGVGGIMWFGHHIPAGPLF